MLPIPKKAPTSQEEYDYLINAVYQNGLEQYEIDKAKAREAAEFNWESKAIFMREQMIAEMEANLAFDLINTPEGSRPLTEAERNAKWHEGKKEIDAKLAQYKQQIIEEAVLSVRQPQSKKEVEELYSIYKDIWVQPEMPEPQSFSYDALYQLADGRIYSVREAAFIKARSDIKAIEVPGGTEQDLKELLIFYRDKKDGFPLVKIGFELLTLEEARIAQINEVDAQVSENIKAGFGFALPNDDALYYSLSEIDQLNFSNMANAANLLIQARSQGKIDWQAWERPDHVKGDIPVRLALPPEDFLSLYTQGALAHIQDCLSQGRAVKYNILAANTKAEVASLVVEPTKIVKARNR